ncbi:SCP2 sterol-binding domain-containing protein [Virgibacillus sp. MSP4-1]|uniref:SCP2 sterol-binding domain-containing protein n=1 Tax=Virgibacillus sp. MSP4-1 TaxID=2700081 RepID=UPI00039B5A38|nr:SCP2 sterol-binding domain-containing protein [Virgibacillus sp. MSP4-1]QHS22706.1 SCP2 sterol-binding domain-containing protein [Virgibacillus sp. MSP4-1]
MSEVKGIFEEINTALKEDPSYVEGVNAVYQFDLEGEEPYQLVLRGDDSYAKQGTDEEADCTLKMNTDDFKALSEGNLNGTQAFMSGRLKIKGNMGLALKLQDILSSYKAASK